MCACGRRNCSECGPVYEFYSDAYLKRELKKQCDAEFQAELRSREDLKKTHGIDPSIPIRFEHSPCPNGRLWLDFTTYATTFALAPNGMYSPEHVEKLKSLKPTDTVKCPNCGTELSANQVQ